MLHGREGADRRAELHALLHVVGGDLERALGDTDLRRGERDERDVVQPAQQLARVGVLAAEHVLRRRARQERD